jgi:hypothetical protein
MLAENDDATSATILLGCFAEVPLVTVSWFCAVRGNKWGGKTPWEILIQPSVDVNNGDTFGCHSPPWRHS